VDGEQLTLLGARPMARCGYCGRELVQRRVGCWVCSRCDPLLADVRDLEGWRRFHRDARADWVGSPLPAWWSDQQPHGGGIQHA
jgi:hypothetical protein